MKSLQKFIIDGTEINEDLLGKKAAEHELTEIEEEIKLCYAKMRAVIVGFFVPLVVVWTLTIIGGMLNDWTVSDIFTGLIVTGVIVGVITLFILGAYTSDNNNLYENSKKKLHKLQERRKKLLRFVNVEADLYEHSQAREIAPLLLARIRKHNRMIEEGSRMIKLQETLDRNSETKLFEKLEKSISEKVRAEYRDLRSRLDTYGVMKEMRADTSLEMTAALMDIEDLNKSDLDKFLTEQQESMKLLLDDKDEDNRLLA